MLSEALRDTRPFRSPARRHRKDFTRQVSTDLARIHRLTGCRKMHLEWNATCGFAFGDRCFGPFCDSLLSVFEDSHLKSMWHRPREPRKNQERTSR